MTERAEWRILLDKVISDPQERQRIAQTLGVRSATLTRWTTNKSNPRQDNLLALLDALPDYRQQLSDSMKKEFPHFEEREDKTVERATLKLLRLQGVGPAMSIECELAPRLNLLTGDNGMGKTFLLECAWWALTGIWAGYPAHPREDAKASSISFQVGKDDQTDKIQTVKYNWKQLAWNRSTELNVLSGLTLFSQADGSFVVWDPAKYVWSREERHVGEALIRFSRSDVFNGVREVDILGRVGKGACDGLIYDWIRWQEAADQTRFQELSAILHHLSPDPQEEPLIPGVPTRMLDIGDSRDIPTLKFPYGDVPILLCSAGVQRVASLAYLLVWAWQEHLKTAEHMRKEPTRSIVLLIDEIEAHLHPRWQRSIVPALTNVVKVLSDQVETQLLVATHSPLVLASIETLFEHDKDKLFLLSLENDLVQLDEVPFIKRGPVNEWLVSEVFGLAEPRSKEAEKAIEDAKEVQLQKNPPQEKVQEISDRLVKVLASDDEFWPTWVYFAKQRGVRFDARRNAS
jgi:transcriptional regulator with XRE-family HTH domain